MSEQEATELKRLIEQRVDAELESERARRKAVDANYDLLLWINKQVHPTIH